MSAIYASDTQVDGIWYDFDSSTKTAYVTYRGSAYDSYKGEYSGSVIIPETVTYNGSTYSVTGIGEDAFCGCSSLTSVTIPNSVTSIGGTAFYGCSSLTSVTIPESVTSIGDHAFQGCSSLPVKNNLRYADTYLVKAVNKTLSTYSIKEGTKWVGDYAFDECSSLTSITIPNSVTSIGDDAFRYCSSLTSVTIPNSVTSIGDYAFYHCSSLTSVTIPESVTSIGHSAFCNCSSLTSVTIPNSVTSIGDWAFAGCSSLTSITIPNGVTTIGRRAFDGCSSLTSVTIPESVTSIGDYAFYHCSSLTSVTIPESVTSIGDAAFIYCSALTSITIPNSVTSIGNYAFNSCSKLTSVTIGESVTSIGGGAFYGCASLPIENNLRYADTYLVEAVDKTLSTYSIKEGTKWVGSSAFYNCQSLTSIKLPNSVTSIGNSAFRGCSKLTSITIPKSVTSIGDGAFSGCSSLTSATIPNSVTSIGIEAFAKCYSLTSITCEATTPPTVGANAFSYVSTSIPIYVPCGSENAYKAASGWKEFTNIQEPQVEYAIQVSTSNSQMGTAIVNYNSCAGNQISATANYGYHFVHWSDGNTDNPRSLVLTQDTTLTAKFAPNKYTITTVSSDTQRGTTKGDTTVNYLEYITISATASYGYHFVQWNDGNSVNPRQVQVTKDMTYSAYFDKNTYAISLSCNEEQGSVEGVTSAEYLDTVTISATPNIGYHFVQWSDGVTDNPRTLELTQDTTFSAEFAQSISGQCGDNLYWSYNETANTISITGSGEMYDYTASTQPWLLFKEQIVEVTTTNTVTSIGTSAFEGCIRLSKISLGTGLKDIAAYAFAGCTRLYDIYVYATYPPFAEESSFANYNVYVYIPCEYQRDYILDVVWGNFKFIECIESEDVTTDGVLITPSTNDVTITWPTEGNADTYTIVIKKGDTVFCTLTFNADGQLLNIAFAPGRDGNHPAQYAEQAGNGYRFTVTGLESGTKYGYNIDVKDASNKTIKSHSGEFTTQTATSVENTNSPSPTIDCQKILYEDHIYILRDGKIYTIMGAEVK